MLTPADTGLVARDTRMTALSLLLDADALSDWLTDWTGVACTVRPRRLRYKPATTCVLSFELETATGAVLCMAKAHSPDTLPKLRKSAHRAPIGAVVAVDAGLGLLVTTLVADRDLRALAALHDEHRRARLLRGMLPDRRAHAATTLRTLRHNPERRWVGVLEVAGSSPVVLRAYAGQQTTEHSQAYAALQTGAPRTPQLLGTSGRHGLTAVEWAPGHTLSGALADADHLDAAGTALAQLHARDPGGPLRLRSHRQAEASAVLAAGAQIGALLPELTVEARAFAELVARRLLRLRPIDSVLHGDFSADQVVVHNGEVTLIDLDAACVGDPAADLACASAALSRRAGADRALIDALCSGYERVRALPSPEHLAVHGAAHLLRRAVEPFRNREAGWAEQVRHLLDLAQGRLAGARDHGAW